MALGSLQVYDPRLIAVVSVPVIAGIVVMHDLNLAGAYCERIALMYNGAIFREGTPQEVLTYSNIEAVYKTIVLVDNGTAGGRPNIILVPGEK